MTDSIVPLTTVSFGETPVHSSLAVFEVVLVLTLVVVTPLLPIELSHSVHLALLPLTLIAFAVEPSILALTMELIVMEVASVVLRVLRLADVVEQEVRIINELSLMLDLGVDALWLLPGEFLQCLLNHNIELFISLFHKCLDVPHSVCWVGI